MKILVINGVNMNMLGFRETEKYGTMTLKDLEKDLYAFSFELGIDLETYQSNIEGKIVEKIHSAKDGIDGEDFIEFNVIDVDTMDYSETVLIHSPLILEVAIGGADVQRIVAEVSSKISIDEG